MSVLMYVIGGAAIAAGGLAAGRSLLLQLATAPAGSRGLPHAARTRPATMPGLRRGTWNGIGIGLGSVVTGTLLVLSVTRPALGWLAAAALTAQLIWLLGSVVASHVQHRPAG